MKKLISLGFLLSILVPLTSVLGYYETYYYPAGLNPNNSNSVQNSSDGTSTINFDSYWNSKLGSNNGTNVYQPTYYYTTTPSNNNVTYWYDNGYNNNNVYYPNTYGVNTQSVVVEPNPTNRCNPYNSRVVPGYNDCIIWDMYYDMYGHPYDPYYYDDEY